MPPRRRTGRTSAATSFPSHCLRDGTLSIGLAHSSHKRAAGVRLDPLVRGVLAGGAKCGNLVGLGVWLGGWDSNPDNVVQSHKKRLGWCRLESGLVGLPEQFREYRPTVWGRVGRLRAQSFNILSRGQVLGRQSRRRPRPRAPAPLDCRRDRRALTTSSLKRRRGERTFRLSAPPTPAVRRTSWCITFSQHPVPTSASCSGSATLR